MPGGYDIVTIDNKVHVVAWRGTHLAHVSSESAHTREEAIANMRTLLAKQRVLGNDGLSVESKCEKYYSK